MKLALQTQQEDAQQALLRAEVTSSREEVEAEKARRLQAEETLRAKLRATEEKAAQAMAKAKVRVGAMRVCVGGTGWHRMGCACGVGGWGGDCDG